MESILRGLTAPTSEKKRVTIGKTRNRKYLQTSVKAVRTTNLARHNLLPWQSNYSALLWVVAMRVVEPRERLFSLG